MGNANWQTPDIFFNVCDRIWGPLTFDAAADAKNSKAPSRLDAAFDSLKNDWPFEYQKVWLNPPYKNLWGWCERIILEAHKRQNMTVALLPIPRGDGWIGNLRRYAELVEVDGRIKFIDPEKKDRISPVGGNILAVMRPPIPGVAWPVGYSGMRVNWTVINGKA